jgi:phage baseplate assembly protein W|tara:strand:+ start:3659 stop:4072 length:414 start_codon:yes stop_codon:yes gene_type:complete
MAQKVFTANTYSDFDLAFTRVGQDTPYAIAIKRNENSIVQSIKNLVLTNPGEKPFEPGFGGGLSSLLFETLTPEVIGRVNSLVRYNLTLYEPRVEFESLEIDDSKIDSNNVFINLSYRILENREIVRTVQIQVERAI